MKYIDTRNMTEAEWLEHRKSGIGGSDAACIFGMNPWMSPYDLYLSKKGLGDAIEETERMRMGHVMEPVIANLYAQREKKKIANVNRILIHPKYDFIRANVDRRIISEKRYLECKNVDGFIFHRADWGAEYTSDIPEYYFIQCHHYGLFPQFRDGGDLAAIVGGNKLMVYTIEPDKEISEMLISGYSTFWNNFIKSIPPDALYMSDIDKRWKHAIGESIDATPEIEDIANKLAFYKRMGKKVSGNIDTCKMALKEYMKDNAVLNINGCRRHTWKNQVDNRFQIKEFRDDYPDLCEEYTKSKTIRKFL